MPIPSHRPAISKQELESVLNCLIEDQISQGGVTRRFERSFASIGAYPYALAVSSLASAYHLAYLALGVGAGDTIVMSALAPLQAYDGASYVSANIQLIDIGRDCFHPTPQQIEATIARLLEEGAARDGKGIFFLLDHTFGAPAPDPCKWLRQQGIRIIEDFTGLVGSEQEGRCFGNQGDIALCGLAEHDLLTTGNGAVLTTPKAGLYKKMSGLRYGKRRERGSIAYDYRLEDFRAAMGLDQLSRLGPMLERRRQIARYYMEVLMALPHETYFRHPGVDAYLKFPLLIHRDPGEVRRYFRSLQIELAPLAEPPLHHLLGLPVERYPDSERLCQRAVGLPIYPTLSAESVKRIISALKGLV